MNSLEKKKDVKSLIYSDGVQNKLKEILGKNASTFAASVVQISSQSAQLARCDPSSILGSAMTAATLDLPLNQSIGQAYIVPFKDKAQFIIGYKGLKQLAMRSGQYQTMNYGDVREGEIKSRDRLTGTIEFDWIENDAKREQLPIIGYFSYYKLLNGFESMYYMSIESIKNHGKKYSKSYHRPEGNWQSDFPSMAKKTVIKLHLNQGEAPLSIQMQQAIQKDQAVISYDEENETEDISYDDVTEKSKKTEVDHDKERIMLLINEATTPEDFEFAKASSGGDYDKEIDERIKTLIVSAESQEDLDAAKKVAGESHIDLIKKKQKQINSK